MARPPVDIHKVLLDAMDKWIKVVCYLVVIWISFDLIITLPPEIANRIFEAIFKKLGI
jgi:membrane-anchored glycerophosphoryl diester phosphodiesterase (GDPDase)